MKISKILAPAFLFSLSVHISLAQPLPFALGQKVPIANQQGALRQTSKPWTVVCTTDAHGITINQYVNTAGVVFAVSWSGTGKPDLQQLLGQYFPQLPVGPGMIAQSGSDDLVIVSLGSMPKFHGYAQLKSQTPGGFSFNNQ